MVMVVWLKNKKTTCIYVTTQIYHDVDLNFLLVEKLFRACNRIRGNKEDKYTKKRIKDRVIRILKWIRYVKDKINIFLIIK